MGRRPATGGVGEDSVHGRGVVRVRVRVDMDVDVDVDVGQPAVVVDVHSSGRLEHA